MVIAEKAETRCPLRIHAQVCQNKGKVPNGEEVVVSRGSHSYFVKLLMYRDMGYVS